MSSRRSDMPRKIFQVTTGPPTETEPFGATSYPLGPLEGRVPGPYEFASTRSSGGAGAYDPPAIPQDVLASSSTSPLAMNRIQQLAVPPGQLELDQPTWKALQPLSSEGANTQIGQMLRLPPQRLISIRPDGKCKDHSTNPRRFCREGTVVFIVGTERAESDACSQCQAGRGPFTSCVVVEGTTSDGGRFFDEFDFANY